MLQRYAEAIAIDEQKYLAELTDLLGFMSSWDRDAALKRYERMLFLAKDPQALMEELGTPTKIAVELARDYVPSPPPEKAAGWPEPLSEPKEETIQETHAAAAEEDAVPAPAPEPASEPVEEQPPARPKRPGGTAGALFWLFALAIGVPVGLFAIAIGIPLLVAGISLAAYLILYIPAGLMRFHLFSDVLFVSGAGLTGLALSVLVSWLGLWLSLTLCRLWIECVLMRLYSRAAGRN
ncbi:MAG: hypothetical protein IJU29_06690 [Oscillospiraceae bacterium]|nr:hypothetical protein [Oscillospiraceae bacterium]